MSTLPSEMPSSSQPPAVAAAPTAGTVDVRHLVATTLQVGLLAFAIWAVEIEKASGFAAFVPFLVAAWAVHYVLPARLKPVAFLAFSIVAIVFQLGVASGWVLLLGLGLVGIAHLPASYAAKAGLLAVAAAVLMALRVGYGGFGWAAAAIPTLASMFMFRMMLYLQDPGRADIPWSTRLSYFFMLPNAFFPVFPIVDWGAYRAKPKTPLHQLHRRGIQWIGRGIVHILLYRVVYHLVLPADWDLVDAGSMIVWVFAIYLLYLRMSGQYHIIGGVLLLFGFDLPETHHLYYFSSSFTDFWRRTNSYWTQYQQKVFFFPLFLRLRRAGYTQPMIPAVLLLFFLTWLLHGWQWFFLAGYWTPTWTDSIFWAVLGTCVALNAQYDLGRKATGATVTLGGWLHTSIQTVAFFCAMSMFWAFWYTDSPTQFLSNVGLALVDPADFFLLAAALVALVAGGVALQAAVARPEVGAWLERVDTSRNLPLSLASCILIAAFARVAPNASASDARLETLRVAVVSDHLNQQDKLAKTRGYYEVLQPKANATTAAAWSGSTQTPPDWVPLVKTELVRRVAPPLQYDLVPSVEGTFLRQPFHTNSHGLRDREYALEKPAGTFRIALLGASYEMGSGVADGEVFEQVAEDRLNREHAGGRHARYEILNFSIAGYTTPQVVATYAEKARAFAPDLVICTSHAIDPSRQAQDFSMAPALMLGSPNPTVRSEGERLWASGSPMEVERGVRARADVITTALWRQLVEEVAADGGRTIWVYVPMTEEDPSVADQAFALQLGWAQGAGLLPISLRGAYGGLDTTQLVVAPWDTHPNPAAHTRLADRLVNELVAADAAYGLGIFR